VILPLITFAQLAASCGPQVHVDTLAAVARTESAFQTDAIYDNTDRRQHLPKSREEAVAVATELVTVKRHSVDVGLMQINSANLAALGVTLAEAFDPCKSIGAGARLLAAAYKPPASGQDAQPALTQALSRYNTGDSTKGVVNGYVAKVQAAAEQVVPAIRLVNASRTGQAAEEPIATESPPSWDVFAQARFARSRARFIGSATGKQRPVQAPLLNAPQWQRQPVLLQGSLSSGDADAP
jgi:type IV secretion system protein VirB1